MRSVSFSFFSFFIFFFIVFFCSLFTFFSIIILFFLFFFGILQACLCAFIFAGHSPPSAGQPIWTGLSKNGGLSRSLSSFFGYVHSTALMLMTLMNKSTTTTALK